MPLNLMNIGETCRVCSILGPREAAMRLVNMGFTPGAPLKIICKNGLAVIVSVRDSRIVLDENLACRIQVGA